MRATSGPGADYPSRVFVPILVGLVLLYVSFSVQCHVDNYLSFFLIAMVLSVFLWFMAF